MERGPKEPPNGSKQGNQRDFSTNDGSKQGNQKDFSTNEGGVSKTLKKLKMTLEGLFSSMEKENKLTVSKGKLTKLTINFVAR